MLIILKKISLALPAMLLVAGCSESKKQMPAFPTPEVAVMTVAPQPLVLTTDRIFTVARL